MGDIVIELSGRLDSFFRLRYFAVLVILGMNSVASADYEYYDFSYYTDLNYEAFQELVTAGEHKTVEGALAALKLKYPGYFNKYILMYKSRSLQQASFMAPRAILFDNSAQFVFSFNGDPKHRGYNRIEIMQFRPDEARFEFREVVFSRDGSQLPKFSQANPRKCMVCHQSTNRKNIDPRPNWEPYNIWPGAYGSLNGGVLPKPPRHIEGDLKQKGAHPSVFDDAKKEYLKVTTFYEHVKPMHDRYKYLGGSSYFAKATTQFTQYLGNLNARRLARIMTEDHTEVFDYVKWPLLSMLRKNCRKLAVSQRALDWLKIENRADGRKFPPMSASIRPKKDELLELAANRELRQSGLEYDESDIAALVREIKREKSAGYWLFPSFGLDPYETSKGIEMLFETLGVDTADWSMDFQTDASLAFSERFGMPSFVYTTLYDGYVYQTGDPDGVANMSCRQIEDRSMQAMDALIDSEFVKQRLTQKFERKAKRPTMKSLINRCANCHVEEDPSIPYIDFKDTKSLKPLLSLPALYSPGQSLLQVLRYRLSDVAEEHDRMPMGPIVDRKLRQQLVKYFEELAGEPHKGIR